jgi:hypothetical protein
MATNSNPSTLSTSEPGRYIREAKERREKLKQLQQQQQQINSSSSDADIELITYTTELDEFVNASTSNTTTNSSRLHARSSIGLINTLRDKWDDTRYYANRQWERSRSDRVCCCCCCGTSTCGIGIFCCIFVLAISAFVLGWLWRNRWLLAL